MRTEINEVTFDHTKDAIHDALGITEEEFEAAVDRANANNYTDKLSKVIRIENLVNSLYEKHLGYLQHQMYLNYKGKPVTDADSAIGFIGMNLANYDQAKLDNGGNEGLCFSEQIEVVWKDIDLTFPLIHAHAKECRDEKD